MRFEALIVHDDDEMIAERVYVEAADVHEAWNKVSEQRPADYYTAWCHLDPHPEVSR
jgi:hypothetical protein